MYKSFGRKTRYPRLNFKNKQINKYKYKVYAANATVKCNLMKQVEIGT